MLIGTSEVKKDDTILFSCFNEQKILEEIIDKIKVNKYFVDIGASDGITFSNTYNLLKSNWKGLSIEPRSDAFSDLSHHYKNLDVICIKNFITPDNVIYTLKSCNVPLDFGFLSLDIDSYDYYVLEKILECYKPSIICTEINEKIPPPYKFALKYITDISNCHVGQSISLVYELLKKYNYAIVKLEYNNLFAVRKDKDKETFIEKTDVEA